MHRNECIAIEFDDNNLRGFAYRPEYMWRCLHCHTYIANGQPIVTSARVTQAPENCFPFVTNRVINNYIFINM